VELSATDDVARAAQLIASWDYASARTVLVDAVARLDGADRRDQLDGLSARRMLAEVLRELGELGPAHRMAAGVARACRDRYGIGHPATIRALAVLARILHDRGELDRARRGYEQVIATGTDLDRPATRAVLLTRANLALLHRDQGDTGTAVRELTAAYTLFRRAFGGGDLESIRLAAELGRLYSVLGDLPNARRLLAIAYTGARGELGEEHPLTGAVEAALAEVEPPMPSAPVSAPVPAWRPPSRRRTPQILAVCAAGLGALLAVTGVAVALNHRPAPPATDAAAGSEQLATDASGGPARPATDATVGSHPPDPATAGSRSAADPHAAPQDVLLRDDGTSVTITWSDPSGGTGGVLVSVSRAGVPAGPPQTLPPGTRQHRITGLDPQADYCVVLAVIYGRDTVAKAAQVCTKRHAGG
jgi:hypothetical protein